MYYDSKTLATLNPRALPDIMSSPEIRQILKVRSVRKPEAFLTGLGTLKSRKKIQFFFHFFFHFFLSKLYFYLLILCRSIFYTKFVSREPIL